MSKLRTLNRKLDKARIDYLSAINDYNGNFKNKWKI